MPSKKEQRKTKTPKPRNYPRSTADKRAAFVREYLIDLNATQAAIRAGYAKNSAHVTASRLLTDAKVSAMLAEAMKKRAEATDITAERVLKEIALLAFSNMADFAEWNADRVTLKPSSEMSEAATRCVAEVSQTITEAGGSVKFKLHDKVSALEKLGKHLGILSEKMVHVGEGGGPIVVSSMSTEEYKKARAEILKEY